MGIRVSEWVIAIFFSWTTYLATTLPISTEMRDRTLVANMAALLVYLILYSFRHREWAQRGRDWFPQGLMILAYKQMGWFAPPVHTYALEHQWIVWDRLLLDDLHLRAAVESLGPVIPSVLELSYSLVYVVPPVTMWVLYAADLRKRADALLTIYLLGLFLAYAQFPFWPSEPPRTVFPGQDLPGVHTVFRDFNLWLVGSYGIHTSVFPSAHVSGAFAAALAITYLMPERRRLIIAYFAYASLVTIATVYGRYHYAVDAVGGFMVAVVAFVPAVWLIRKAERRAAGASCDEVSAARA